MVLLSFLDDIAVDSRGDVNTFAAIAREYSTLTPREITGVTGLDSCEWRLFRSHLIRHGRYQILTMVGRLHFERGKKLKTGKRRKREGPDDHSYERLLKIIPFSSLRFPPSVIQPEYDLKKEMPNEGRYHEPEWDIKEQKRSSGNTY